LFSEVIDLRLQSVELFHGRIVSGPRLSECRRDDADLVVRKWFELDTGALLASEEDIASWTETTGRQREYA
jgi:hypothetical protein